VTTLSWKDIPHSSFEFEPELLNLRWCFLSGQAFRWKEDPNGWWIGIVRDSVLRIRMDGSTVTWAAYPKLPWSDFWESYLRLDFDLAALYRDYEGFDQFVAYSFSRWRGLRVLSQDPLETITCFLCTTANSIPRITRAISCMSTLYGQHIATIDGIDYYTLPKPEALVEEIAPVLDKRCGLGFRANNLVRAMQDLRSKPTDWPQSLIDMPYPQARAELMTIRGIGRKVADCVALFALRKDEAVPVDTHVWQIALELYLREIKTKSITTKVYETIAEHFRSLFGDRAGWVQQYLFFSHLNRHRYDSTL